MLACYASMRSHVVDRCNGRRRESARASAPLCVRTRRLTGCFINWFRARGAAIYTAADARPALRRDQGLARPATCSNSGIARRENSTLRHSGRRNICALTLRGRGRLGGVSLGQPTRGRAPPAAIEAGGPCRGRPNARPRRAAGACVRVHGARRCSGKIAIHHGTIPI